MSAKKQKITTSTTKVDNTVDETIKRRKIMSPKFINNFTLTAKQKELLKVFSENKIIIISGPAGSSKTWVSIYYILQELMASKFDKVIFTKPIQEAGENLGFLPGNMQEKIDPYYESFRINLLQMMDKLTLNRRYEDGVFENKPLAYLRGTGFRKSILFLDEAQNCDIRSLMMFVTRMGADSKVIITGDVSQHDIQQNLVALPYFSDMIKDIPKVGIFQFNENDIMRDEILIEITKRYENAKMNGTLPKIKKS